MKNVHNSTVASLLLGSGHSIILEKLYFIVQAAAAHCTNGFMSDIHNWSFDWWHLGKINVALVGKWFRSCIYLSEYLSQFGYLVFDIWHWFVVVYLCGHYWINVSVTITLFMNPLCSVSIRKLWAYGVCRWRSLSLWSSRNKVLSARCYSIR